MWRSAISATTSSSGELISTAYGSGSSRWRTRSLLLSVFGSAACTRWWRSRSETMPSTRPSSCTGMCRMRCSSISCSTSSTEASGPTAWGNGVIATPTVGMRSKSASRMALLSARAEIRALDQLEAGAVGIAEEDGPESRDRHLGPHLEPDRLGGADAGAPQLGVGGLRVLDQEREPEQAEVMGLGIRGSARTRAPPLEQVDHEGLGRPRHGEELGAPLA